MSGLIEKKITAGRLLTDNRGFNLAELIVVMAIFLTVMLITSSTFKTIVNQSSQQSKSLETQIEGIVGLEVLRADLEQAGFGLPWTFQTGITYSEANLDASTKPAANYWESGGAENFNDSPGNPPRAIWSRNTKFNFDSGNIGAKYFVIKSANVATNNTAKKWTNLSIAEGGVKTIRTWGASNRDFQANERVIVVKNNLVTTPASRQLMATAATSFSAKFSNYSNLTKNPVDGDNFQIYGIAVATGTDPDKVRMPFNRADYYLMTPAKMPAGCAPGTGVLYKSNINQSPAAGAGGYDPQIPLLDCVADMQIVYGLDNDGAGRVNQYLEAPATTASPTAADIRSQLREVRVYILTQDGNKDVMYKYPAATVAVGETLHGVFRGRNFDLEAILGADGRKYRWKVYTIVVRPKNLIQ